MLRSVSTFLRPLETAEEGQIVFSGGVYVGKHTSQAASVRAKASARSGLHPLEKMLAFLRSVSKFFDKLKSPVWQTICHTGFFTEPKKTTVHGQTPAQRTVVFV